jgi:hypothetical protein
MILQYISGSKVYQEPKPRTTLVFSRGFAIELYLPPTGRNNT